MSVEKEVRKARRAMIWWRITGDVIGFPKDIFKALAKFFNAVERSIFYYELDAARRYRALTGVDLSIGLGEGGRYTGIDAESSTIVNGKFHAELESE